MLSCLAVVIDAKMVDLSNLDYASPACIIVQVREYDM